VGSGGVDVNGGDISSFFSPVGNAFTTLSRNPALSIELNKLGYILAVSAVFLADEELTHPHLAHQRAEEAPSCAIAPCRPVMPRRIQVVVIHTVLMDS